MGLPTPSRRGKETWLAAHVDIMPWYNTALHLSNLQRIHTSLPILFLFGKWKYLSFEVFYLLQVNSCISLYVPPTVGKKLHMPYWSVCRFAFPVGLTTCLKDLS